MSIEKKQTLKHRTRQQEVEKENVESKDFAKTCDHPFQTDPGSDDIQPGNVDFAASDSLLKDEEYETYPDLQMYPSVGGAVVPIFNLKEYHCRT